jgi:hypothetical protein
VFRSWGRDDIEVAVAWQTEQALLCPSCGLPRDETMAKEATFGFEASPQRCHACAAIGRAHERFRAGPHDPNGLTFSVKPVT